MNESGPVSASLENELLHVRLPVFDGPLDLLLHLVRKHELDIQELRLAELTEPYLAYLDRIENLDLDSAGEFLSIAATLVWIKSKSLLPRDFEDDSPEPADEEARLMERLREYQRIKDAALQIAGLDVLGRDRFARQVARVAEEELGADDDSPPEIEGVSLYQLIQAFGGLLERSKAAAPLEVVPEAERIDDKIGELLSRFETGRRLAFEDLFDPRSGRRVLVLVFIALLELVRLKAIRITQAGNDGAILCQASESFMESPVDWKGAVLAALGGGPPQTAQPKPEIS